MQTSVGNFNRGVFVARERCAAFLLLAVRRADLNELRLRGNRFGYMRVHL
jgi:hypothetical protein